MSVKATVLVENSVHGNLGALAEHGWSVWLETPAGTFLFDTGQGNALPTNAAYFGVPLAEAQAILLSHHHIDHTGGLLNAVRSVQHGAGRQGVPVYGHPDLFKDSFIDRNGQLHFVGLPHTRGALETAGAEFRLTTGWQEIAPGLCLTGEIPRRTAYELGEPNLKHRDASGSIVVDPIRDDQTLAIDTPDGLFVVLGCSHAGLINILTYISARTGQTRFHTIMGGTHLGPMGDEQVDRTLAALHEFDIAHRSLVLHRAEGGGADGARTRRTFLLLQRRDGGRSPIAAQWSAPINRRACAAAGRGESCLRLRGTCGVRQERQRGRSTPNVSPTTRANTRFAPTNRCARMLTRHEISYPFGS